MSVANEKQTVTIRDLVDEAKKRIVLLVTCVFGLSYLMSLTSASVLANLPAAISLILLLRYMSLDFEMRRKAATYKGNQTANVVSEGNIFRVLEAVEKPDWRFKVNSPVVADALEQFTRHIVSEWVTDLWYSRITPDRQGPEELVSIMNGFLGEISSRLRHINLITLLTRDVIKILCSNLELFRTAMKKIEKHHAKSLTIEEQDIKLKSILAADKNLHPILFSPEAEYKVLQQVVDGLLLVTFQPEDFQCSFFRYVSRELLSCAVIRSVLNLANPRFLNERIELAVVSADKGNKENRAESASSPLGINESTRALSDQGQQFLEPSFNGVELVHLKKDQNRKMSNNLSLDDLSGTLLSKDPLLSLDTRSWSSLPDGHGAEIKEEKQEPTGEWGDVLDAFSHRKTEVLAPEHFENMWTKGRNYKLKEDGDQYPKPALMNSRVHGPNTVEKPKFHPEQGKNQMSTLTLADKDFNGSHHKRDQDNGNSALQENFSKSEPSEESDSWSSSYTEDDDSSNVMRLDSPGVKVWDSKNKPNVSHIHHPLENFEKNNSRKKDKIHSKRLHRTKFAKKRSRSSIQNGQVQQEGERTTFLLGEGHDALKFSKENMSLELSEDSEPEFLDRSNGGVTASSSAYLAFLPESHHLAVDSTKNSTGPESFFRLRCEVMGANIVKCGPKTFAVYSVSVTDVNHHSWSIKRRYQHFEDLHKRLKEFPEYNLHLPPKHFLSTSLGVSVIQERCRLLDQYLKNLFQLPKVSCSIEVWDFLSVDSQMYVFSDSLYILETLQVVSDKSKEHQGRTSLRADPSSSKRRNINDCYTSAPSIKSDQVSGGIGSRENGQVLSLSKNPESQFIRASQNTSSALGDSYRKETSSQREERTPNNDLKKPHSDFTNNASDPTLPSEWVPPNLSVPILDLVDVILQLKDGGWIRRKTFWAAKQVLQLGMGDAFDDWLIEKIQVLRRGSVIASGIRRLETVLWPDGIFITKHPSRQRSSSGSKLSSPYSSPKVEDAVNLEEMKQQEAERRAKFVYELMIENAPAVIVGLVGRKEYEKCAKDLYYFIQSSVFLKLLAFDLFQLVVLSAFPELDNVFKQFDQEKDKFGEPMLS